MMPAIRSTLARALAPLVRAIEGQSRPGPWNLPITGGWLTPDAPSYGNFSNWWQLGGSPVGGERSAVVARCIALYAQTTAMLPGAHWRRNALGGRTRVTSSALSRILRSPNDYQTSSDFILNLVDSLYRDGNAYALALRNDRFEIASLHLMNSRSSAPMVAHEGSLFYALSGNALIDRLLGEKQIIVPQRDVLHVRLNSGDRHPAPLLGETPLLAAMADVVLGTAHAQQQMQFLANQARPSAVLSTDLVLDQAQVQIIRDRWNEQAKGLHQGGVPILSAGLKVQPWNVPAKDAQLAELAKLSAERICWAYGIPLQLLGLGGAPFSSTESLLRFWLSTGLGFALNHVEQSFDRLFGLEGEPDDYTEFNSAALLRSDQKDRIEALVRGVQGGVYSPNEARAAEDLDAVPYGDEPRVQAQVVPLSAAGMIPSAPAAPVSPSTEVAAKHLEALRAFTRPSKKVPPAKQSERTVRKIKDDAHVS